MKYIRYKVIETQDAKLNEGVGAPTKIITKTKKDKVYKNFDELVKDYPELSKYSVKNTFRKHLSGVSYKKIYKHKNGRTYTTVQTMKT